MSYCVVPFCKSDGKKKVRTISFHQFPVENQLREAWIKAISRKDSQSNKLWVPRDYSSICSLHFEDSCFSKSTKYRRLLPGSVPTIFSDYPQYFKNNKRKQETLNSSNKRRAVNVTIDKKATNMVYCSVPFCKSSSSDPEKGIGFHKFPVETRLREQWMNALCRKGPQERWMPTDASRVCNLHFEDSCYSTSTTRRQLLPNSVPTIFKGYPAYLQNDKKPKERITRNSIKKRQAKIKSRNILSLRNSNGKNGRGENKGKCSLNDSIKTEMLNEDDSSKTTSFSVDGNLRDFKVQSTDENFVRKSIDKRKKSADDKLSCNSIQTEILAEDETHWLKFSNIKLPNIWWTFNSLPTFSVFSKWSENFQIQRRVVLESDRKVSVYLHDCEVKSSLTTVQNVEELSSLLIEVDKYTICTGAKNRLSRSCLGFVSPNDITTSMEMCSKCRNNTELAPKDGQLLLLSPLGKMMWPAMVLRNPQ